MDDNFEDFLEAAMHIRPKHTTIGQAFKRGMFMLFCVLCIISWAGYEFVVGCLDPIGTGSNEKVIQVVDGCTADEVLEKLEEEGLITSSLVSKVYMKFFGTNTVYAGEYRLNDGMSVSEIMEYVSNPENATLESNALTVTDGMLAKQIALRITAVYPEYTPEDILEKWNDRDYIKELAQDYEFIEPKNLKDSDIQVKLEGYLYPETYFLAKDATIDDITRTMLNHFDEVVYRKYRTEIQESEYSLEELLTLASIVQFETSAPKDMFKIAGVFYNRLEQGMRLESSATVCYAMGEVNPIACETNPGIDSPYNTYVVQGIPIAPICNPNVNAIQAVLEPEDNNYLFFAADIKMVSPENTGGVFYSETYEEHNKVLEELDLLSIGSD